jgi:hypothetical protein
MAFVHGSKAKFLLGTAGTPGTPVDVSAYLYTVTMPRTIDTAETSTFGNIFKTHVPGLYGTTISLDGRYDPAIDAQLSALIGVVNVAFTWNPQGTATGLVSYTGTGFLSAYQDSTPLNDVGAFTATMQISSAVTRAIQP